MLKPPKVGKLKTNVSSYFIIIPQLPRTESPLREGDFYRGFPCLAALIGFRLTPSERPQGSENARMKNRKALVKR